MNPSFIVAFAVGMLLMVTGGQGLVCSPWVHKSQTLIYEGPDGTCYGPEVHLSGDNWRLCCARFGNRQLTMTEPVEPFISARTGARSFEKCTRWMDAATVSRIALAENACNSSLVSQMEDGEMRICCV